MPIFQINEVLDDKGFDQKTVCFVKAKTEEGAIEKANENGFHVESNGFYPVTKLSKKEGKKVAIKFYKTWCVVSDMTEVLAEEVFEDDGSFSEDTLLKRMFKNYDKKRNKLYLQLQLLLGKNFNMKVTP